MDNLRILIADDDPGMRLVLRKIIGNVEGFNLIGEAENGKEALEMADTLRPDILLPSSSLPPRTIPTWATPLSFTPLTTW